MPFRKLRIILNQQICHFQDNLFRFGLAIQINKPYLKLNDYENL